ncbi:MAG: hypothetical protein QXX68_03350 [Candidatus Pacearchaeota archaeon]
MEYHHYDISGARFMKARYAHLFGKSNKKIRGSNYNSLYYLRTEQQKFQQSHSRQDRESGIEKSVEDQ